DRLERARRIRLRLSGAAAGVAAVGRVAAVHRIDVVDAVADSVARETVVAGARADDARRRAVRNALRVRAARARRAEAAAADVLRVERSRGRDAGARAGDALSVLRRRVERVAHRRAAVRAAALEVGGAGDALVADADLVRD